MTSVRDRGFTFKINTSLLKLDNFTIKVLSGKFYNALPDHTINVVDSAKTCDSSSCPSRVGGEMSPLCSGLYLKHLNIILLTFMIHYCY